MGDVSVYVHFPWCARKCPYCDFSTTAIDPRTVPHQAYAEAVIRDVDSRRDLLSGRSVCSVFFGGGTPSIWRAHALGSVLDAVASHGNVLDSLEVTAECNPASFDNVQATELRAVGVNRFSIGVQSLRDAHLRFLGRLHDRVGALKAIDAATQHCDRVSADLIFGMPGHTTAELRDDIRTLVDRGVTHVSAYALTVEPGTPFYQRRQAGRLPIVDDHQYAELYQCAQQTLTASGFEHYEVSSYARPGERSRHNMHYWLGGDYIGVGAAAVGCVLDAQGSATRWRNHADVDAYMSTDSFAGSTEVLGPRDLVREAWMLGLRTSDGVDLAAVGQRAGIDPVHTTKAGVSKHEARGNLATTGGRMFVPQSRWLSLDTIVCDLF